MCGQYYCGDDGADSKVRSLMRAMEAQFPGAYKTGDIFPGDTAPAMIAPGMQQE